MQDLRSPQSARERIASRVNLGLFAATTFVSSADAQVVLIPHGDYENNYEKILIVIVSLALLVFAAYRGGQLEWFKRQFRKIFRRD